MEPNMVLLTAFTAQAQIEAKHLRKAESVFTGPVQRHGKKSEPAIGRQILGSSQRLLRSEIRSGSRVSGLSPWSWPYHCMARHRRLGPAPANCHQTECLLMYEFGSASCYSGRQILHRGTLFSWKHFLVLSKYCH